MARRAFLGAMVLLAGCGLEPPRSYLHFRQSGDTTWVREADGTYSASFFGAIASLRLDPRHTSVEVRIRNETAAPVEFRIGPEASPQVRAIGTVLLRPLHGPPGGPDLMPYNSLQSQLVAPDWRATFYLDAPAGDAPGLGKILVLTVEGHRDGRCERRILPLVATNSGRDDPVPFRRT